MQVYARSTTPHLIRNLGLLVPVVAHGSPAEICERTVTLFGNRLQKKQEEEESAGRQSISA
jgi:hypothetical protein